MSCILESRCCCLFVTLFLYFLPNFQTLKFFVTLFSGTVRPRRLKLRTHVNSGQMYRVYWTQAAAGNRSLYFFIFLSLQFSNIKVFCHTFLRNCEAWNVFTGIKLLLFICLFISSVFFLSSFQTLKNFVALFSGTVRPIKLKLDTHVDSVWMYPVYRNQAAASYLSLISSFCFLSSVQKLKKKIVTLFSGTVRPRKFKHGTLVDSGWMYCVYQNQAAAVYLSLYSFNFSFSPIIKH